MTLSRSFKTFTVRCTNCRLSLWTMVKRNVPLFPLSERVRTLTTTNKHDNSPVHLAVPRCHSIFSCSVPNSPTLSCCGAFFFYSSRAHSIEIWREVAVKFACEKWFVSGNHQCGAFDCLCLRVALFVVSANTWTLRVSRKLWYRSIGGPWFFSTQANKSTFAYALQHISNDLLCVPLRETPTTVITTALRTSSSIAKWRESEKNLCDLAVGLCWLTLRFGSWSSPSLFCRWSWTCVQSDPRPKVSRQESNIRRTSTV